jgi:hypothetical protein
MAWSRDDQCHAKVDRDKVKIATCSPICSHQKFHLIFHALWKVNLCEAYVQDSESLSRTYDLISSSLPPSRHLRLHPLLVSVSILFVLVFARGISAFCFYCCLLSPLYLPSLSDAQAGSSFALVHQSQFLFLSCNGHLCSTSVETPATTARDTTIMWSRQNFPSVGRGCVGRGAAYFYHKETHQTKI